MVFCQTGYLQLLWDQLLELGLREERSGTSAGALLEERTADVVAELSRLGIYADEGLPAGRELHQEARQELAGRSEPVGLPESAASKSSTEIGLAC